MKDATAAAAAVDNDVDGDDDDNGGGGGGTGGGIGDGNGGRRATVAEMPVVRVTERRIASLICKLRQQPVLKGD